MIRVIKIGGAVVDSEEQLSAVLDCVVRSADPVILVHGGGRLATQLAEQLGLPQTMINGRRVTDEATLRIATMVYAGWINKSIVAKLQARGINAIGLSGADGDLIRSKRRDPEPVDFGYVGDPIAVNATLLRELAGEPAGELPGNVSFRAKRGTMVIAPISHDGNGTLLNTNADTIATEVAMALAPDVSLTFAFDHAGVLRDVNDPSSLITKLSRAEADQLVVEGVITSGMMPKLENAFRAAERGVKHVRVARYDALDEEGGTWIV